VANSGTAPLGTRGPGRPLFGRRDGTRIYTGSFVGALVLLLLINRRLKEALILSGVAVLAFLPWPVRNAVLTGNPLFPRRFGPERRPIFISSGNRRAMPAIGCATFGSCLQSDRRGVYLGDGAAAASLAPAAFFTVSDQRTVRRLAFLILVTAVLYATVFPANAFGSERYYGSGCFMLAALLAAYGTRELAQRMSGPVRSGLQALILASILLPHGIVGLYFGLKRVPFLLGRQSAEAYLRRQYQYAEDMRWSNSF